MIDVACVQKTAALHYKIAAYLHPSRCHCVGKFKVVIPDKAGPGVFMLQNGEWAGLHVAIKSHKVQAVSPCRSSVDTHVAIVLC